MSERDQYDEQAERLIEHCRYCEMPEYRRCRSDHQHVVDDVAAALRKVHADCFAKWWEPMECGHPGANFSPVGDAGNEPPTVPQCLVCRALQEQGQRIEQLEAALRRLREWNGLYWKDEIDAALEG